MVLFAVGKACVFGVCGLVNPVVASGGGVPFEAWVTTCSSTPAAALAFLGEATAPEQLPPVEGMSTQQWPAASLTRAWAARRTRGLKLGIFPHWAASGQPPGPRLGVVRSLPPTPGCNAEKSGVLTINRRRGLNTQHL